MLRRYTLLGLISVLAICGQAQTYRGTTVHTWFHNTAVSLYLPQDYFTTVKTYPVLYLLSGTGDSETAWFDEGNAEHIFNSLIGNHSAREMVVVMPHTSGATDGSFEEDFKPLMTYIEKCFRVNRTKRYHAIAGLSLGGFYTMHIAHHLPNEFDYVGLFSAIYTTRKMEIFKKDSRYLFGISETSPRIYKNVERELKREFRIPPKLYFIAIGKRDFLYNQNQLFRSYMKEQNYAYTYHETGGGHEWKNWQAYLTTFLPLLFQDIPDTIPENYNDLDEY